MSVDHELTIAFPRVSPDLDGVSCAVALAEQRSALGQLTLPWYGGRPDAEAAAALERVSHLRIASQSERQHATRLILVDASDIHGFPEWGDPNHVVEVVDHRFHGDPKAVFPRAKLFIEAVGAAATLVVERFREHDLTPSLTSAELLFGGIYSNTLSLAGSISTDRDVEAADWLESWCGVDNRLINELFAAKTRHIVDHLEAVISEDFKQYPTPLGQVEVAQLELHGARHLLEQHGARLRDALSNRPGVACLNIVDISGVESIWLFPSPEWQRLITEHTGHVFENGECRFTPAHLRKQLVPVILGASAG